MSSAKTRQVPRAGGRELAPCSLFIHPKNQNIMEKKIKVNLWLITVKKKYVEAFLRGEKDIELRTRVPKALMPMDKIFVCEGGSGGKVVMQMTVISVIKDNPYYIWAAYIDRLKMGFLEYHRYVHGRKEVFGIKVKDIVKLPEGLTTHDFSDEKAPRWFRDAFPKKRAIELMEKGGLV